MFLVLLIQYGGSHAVDEPIHLLSHQIAPWKMLATRTFVSMLTREHELSVSEGSLLPYYEVYDKLRHPVGSLDK